MTTWFRHKQPGCTWWYPSPDRNSGETASPMPVDSPIGAGLLLCLRPSKASGLFADSIVQVATRQCSIVLYLNAGSCGREGRGYLFRVWVMLPKEVPQRL